MNEVMELEVEESEESQESRRGLQKIDVKEISSPVLARLIEEVRNEETHNTQAYNRMHNRHNRSR